MASRVTESITSSTLLPLIAEILGHGQRDEGGPDPERRRTVRRRNHQNGALQSVWPQLVIDEIAHLAVSLPDESHHADVGRAIPRHRAQQGAFAYAAAAENADSLSLAAGEQAVDGADPGD